MMMRKMKTIKMKMKIIVIVIRVSETFHHDEEDCQEKDVREPDEEYYVDEDEDED